MVDQVVVTEVVKDVDQLHQYLQEILLLFLLHKVKMEDKEATMVLLHQI